MQFGLSESQQMLKDNARKFLAGECPMEEVRRLMETDTAYDETLWKKMAEQGYTGIIFPEEFGGVGLGKVELILLMEEAGRALLPGPFFSTVPLAGAVIDAVASPESKKKYLAPICAGDARSTVAFLEANASWNFMDIHVSAVNATLTGEKLFVPDAAVADFIIVIARNGIFAVASKARHHSGIRQDAEAIRQANWYVSSRAAPVRGYVPRDGKLTLCCLLCCVGARRKCARCFRCRFHCENVCE